jgi:hypothetical protein
MLAPRHQRTCRAHQAVRSRNLDGETGVPSTPLRASSRPSLPTLSSLKSSKVNGSEHKSSLLVAPCRVYRFFYNTENSTGLVKKSAQLPCACDRDSFTKTTAALGTAHRGRRRTDSLHRSLHSLTESRPSLAYSFAFRARCNETRRRWHRNRKHHFNVCEWFSSCTSQGSTLRSSKKSYDFNGC